MCLESRSHFGSRPSCSSTALVRSGTAEYCAKTSDPACTLQELLSIGRQLAIRLARGMYAIHPGGVGFLRLSTRNGTTDYECRILEAFGDETIIAVCGHVDIEESRHFRVGTDLATAVRVATSSVQTRKPDSWAIPQWCPTYRLGFGYHRHFDPDGLSLSASEALPVAQALAPALDRLVQLEEGLQSLRYEFRLLQAPLAQALAPALDRLVQLEEGLQSLRDQFRLLQAPLIASPGLPAAQYSIGSTPRARGAAAPSSQPQDVLAVVLRDPASASLGPLLGGAAASGVRGGGGAESDDSAEDGASGFSTTWGRPNIGSAASVPIGGNSSTPFMQPARSPPPPPAWGAPVQEAGPPDMGQRIPQALPSAGVQRSIPWGRFRAHAASQLAKNLEGTQGKKNPGNPRKDEEE